jgi:hypothetical protein
MGSVCSLIANTRSGVSDRSAGDALGPRQVELWAEALRRAMAFRRAVGEARFADVFFGPLNADPVATVAAAYAQLGMSLGEEGARRMEEWAQHHPRGAHGSHEYALEDFGLEREAVRSRFRFYTEAFGIGGEDDGR